MKLFLDSADVGIMRAWSETGLIDGVTTNPSHLAKVARDPKETVLEICKLFPGGPVSVEVTEKEADQVYRQAHEIAALADNIVVKIPCHRSYYPVIKKLVQDGIALNITLIFSLAQSLFMCKLGVRYISPFVGRWDDIDVDGVALLEEMRYMIDIYGYSTHILAASLRSVRDLHGALLAGADAVTVPLPLLEKAVMHPLTDIGIAKFDADWAKLGVRHFP